MNNARTAQPGVACPGCLRLLAPESDMAVKGKRLNLKEGRFVDAYFGSCRGNATAAVRAAGYRAGTQKSAQVTGSNLLSKPIIRAAIDARVTRAAAKGIASAEERDLRLSEIIRMPIAELHARIVVIAAIKELNKVTGRHSIRHVIDASETLADIIAGSRGPA